MAESISGCLRVASALTTDGTSPNHRPTWRAALSTKQPRSIVAPPASSSDHRGSLSGGLGMLSSMSTFWTSPSPPEMTSSLSR
jgi:hypothetical protein